MCHTLDSPLVAANHFFTALCGRTGWRTVETSRHVYVAAAGCVRLLMVKNERLDQRNF